MDFLLEVERNSSFILVHLSLKKIGGYLWIYIFTIRYSDTETSVTVNTRALTSC